MRRAYSALLVIAMLFLCDFSTPAWASTEPMQLQPREVTVIHVGETTQEKKTYELPNNMEPQYLPTQDYWKNNKHYSMTDMVVEPKIETENKPFTQTVEIKTETDDLKTILGLLPPTQKIDEDGFQGILTLDPTTITVNAAGYGNKKYKTSATRFYPNLSQADTTNIPKEIEQNGKTFSLDNIEWQVDNTQEIDGHAIPNRYTAIAYYSGTATKSYVRGYNVTAKYSGTISKSISDTALYTFIFTEQPNHRPQILGLLIILVITILVFTFYHYRKRHERNVEDETEH